MKGSVCDSLASKKHVFLVMDAAPAAPAPVPPVIDTTRQVRIATTLEAIESKSLFTPFNLGALLVFLLVVFFLYKRYRDKKATENAHSMPSLLQKTA